VNVHTLAINELRLDEQFNPKSPWQGIPKKEARIRDIGEYALLMTMHGCFWFLDPPRSSA
jgi:hypothetical protein